MSFITEFLQQEVPQSGLGMPDYYRRALKLSEAILAVYFIIGTILLTLSTGNREWAPILVLIATVICYMEIDRLSARANLLCVACVIGIWLTHFVYMFGWAAGSPNILVPVLSLAFFNIYEPPRGKLAYSAGLIFFRVMLFAWSLSRQPAGTLSRTSSLCFQVLNSLVPLVTLSLNYILFSSSIQARERQLTINNQELRTEAGTDPLTGLMNRRALLDEIEAFRRENPDEQFAIALADIDFFKKVNDTYGHNCGDYTLVELARLFQTFGENRYIVGRWGGEEFCFFVPQQNLDEAGGIMCGLRAAVKRMSLHFGGVDFSITVTIGVEEYDYQSPTDVIVERADRKLYMGKTQGRDQVVI